LEYPISLSYQPMIFTKFPLITEVIWESNTQEAGLPIMSTETIGSSVYSRMFFKLVWDASLKTAFISEIEVCFATLRVISVREPLGTGTLIPQPPITLLSSGNILVKAFAAP